MTVGMKWWETKKPFMNHFGRVLNIIGSKRITVRGRNLLSCPRGPPSNCHFEEHALNLSLRGASNKANLSLRRLLRPGACPELAEGALAMTIRNASFRGTPRFLSGPSAPRQGIPMMKLLIFGSSSGFFAPIGAQHDMTFEVFLA